MASGSTKILSAVAASLAAQLSIPAEGDQTTAAISRNSKPARQARAAAEVLIDAALSRRELNLP